MKILFIGGTGRLSYDTTSLCIKKQYDVYLLNRGTDKSFTDANAHYLIGDVNDTETVKTIVSGMYFDTIIDYLTYDVDTLINRIECFKEHTDQYIFISSATVFKPSAEPISENTRIGNDGWKYCKNKLLCERYLDEHRTELGFHYTIVRPYVTYDKKRIPYPIISKKSCWNLMDRVVNNKPILMCGDGTQKAALTNTKDFAVGITGLFGNKNAYNEDFNIVGDYYYTWNDVVKEVEQYTGKKALVVSISNDKINKMIPSFAEEILYDKGRTHIFDNTKIKEYVPEFKSTIDLHTGMLQTMDYLQENTCCHIYDKEWNAMEDIVCGKLGHKSSSVGIKEMILYFYKENKAVNLFKSIIK